MIRMMLTHLLTASGHSVTAKESGEPALELLRTEPHDLVLLDVRMPGLDGYEVLERMMGDETLQHIPVVMISTVNDMESVVRCIEKGATDYLPKPFEPSLLHARIKNTLEKKHSRDREMRHLEELKENYRRLEELEKMRDSLTRMIVHDMRTPLTSMLTGVQTLEAMKDDDPDRREVFGLAVEGGQVLLGMINDLLDISKMEDGSFKLERQEVKIPDLMTHGIRQIESLADQKALKVVLDLQPNLPAVRADGDKLLRTIVNLLSNAIKFTPEGGTISALASRASQGTYFAVRDTGEGVPKEYFDRIFEKFGQVETRKSGRKMSTGLGLTFCKMVVEAHGGRIWLESEMGKGSTFQFVLPA